MMSDSRGHEKTDFNYPARLKHSLQIDPQYMTLYHQKLFKHCMSKKGSLIHECTKEKQAMYKFF